MTRGGGWITPNTLQPTGRKREVGLVQSCHPLCHCTTTCPRDRQTTRFAALADTVQLASGGWWHPTIDRVNGALLRLEITVVRPCLSFATRPRDFGGVYNRKPTFESVGLLSNTA
eukprot:scaffold18777_cov123-Isochrysis_galbana.AAC.1